MQNPNVVEKATIKDNKNISSKSLKKLIMMRSLSRMVTRSLLRLILRSLLKLFIQPSSLKPAMVPRFPWKKLLLRKEASPKAADQKAFVTEKTVKII